MVRDVPRKILYFSITRKKARIARSAPVATYRGGQRDDRTGDAHIGINPDGCGDEDADSSGACADEKQAWKGNYTLSTKITRGRHTDRS